MTNLTPLKLQDFTWEHREASPHGHQPLGVHWKPHLRCMHTCASGWERLKGPWADPVPRDSDSGVSSIHLLVYTIMPSQEGPMPGMLQTNTRERAGDATWALISVLLGATNFHLHRKRNTRFVVTKLLFSSQIPRI